jgi:vacuolar-type H+-ATPase subunit H
MSNWDKVRRDLEPSVREIAKIIENYDYSVKSADLTDRKIRKKLTNEARKAKETTLKITELAYKDEESGVVNSLKEITDDIDVFINELDIKRIVYKDASDKLLKKIVKSDLLLIKGMDILNEMLRTTYEQTISGRPGDVVRKAAEIRRNLGELRSIFSERGENV